VYALIQKVGFGGIALNVECELKQAPPSSEKLELWQLNADDRRGKKPFTQLHALRANENNPRDDRKVIKQLKRITLKFEDMSTTHSLVCSRQTDLV